MKQQKQTAAIPMNGHGKKQFFFFAIMIQVSSDHARETSSTFHTRLISELAKVSDEFSIRNQSRFWTRG